MQQVSQAYVAYGNGRQTLITWWYNPDDQWFYVDRGDTIGPSKEISATQMISVINLTPESHKHTPLSQGIFNYTKEHLI